MWPPAARSITEIEIVHELGQYSMTLRGVDNHRGDGRQIDDDIVLEMENEMWIAAQIDEPVPIARTGNTAQIDSVAEPVEADLDSARLSGTSARRGDVDGAIFDGRRVVDIERIAHVISHETIQPRSEGPQSEESQGSKATPTRSERDIQN